jgi:hypothetical protein
MRQNIVDRPHASSRRKASASYWVALALQAVFFYGGFRYLLNTDIPPVYRLIASCVFFPLAVASAWWGGHIALMRRGEKHYAAVQLFETLPVRIFLGVVFASIVIAIVNLASSF